MPLPLEDARPGGSGDPQPSPAELSTRGVIVAIPLREEKRAKFGVDHPDANNPEHWEQAVLCDVIIPGTGFFDYGAAPTKNEPVRQRVALPARINGVWFRGATIWPLEGKAGKAAVLGVVEQGTQGRKGNQPWLFSAPEANDPRRGPAMAAYQSLGLADASPITPLNGYVSGAVAAGTSTATPAATATPTSGGGGITVPGFTPEEFAGLPAGMRAQLLASQAPTTAAAPSIPAAPAGFEDGWSDLSDAQRTQILKMTSTPVAV